MGGQGQKRNKQRKHSQNGGHNKYGNFVSQSSYSQGSHMTGKSHRSRSTIPSHRNGGFMTQNTYPRQRVVSSVSPERRRQLELERKRREDFENNFKCDVQEAEHSDIVQYMKGNQVYNNNQRVSHGMENWGNTCFFNSVMQCFHHTIPLHQFCVSDKNHSLFCKSTSNGKSEKDCLLCQYIDFVKKSDNTGRPPLKQILRYMKKILPSYVSGQQEDAQEYTLGFIDHLIKACFDHPKPVQRFVINHQNKTPIFKIFGFKTRTQVLCERCRNESNTYSENCTLTLPIPRKRNRQDDQGIPLSDCMKQFLDIDRLSGDNQYQCSHCKTKVNATKCTSIETPPCILIIDLIRYSLGRKSTDKINYPKVLNLKNFMSRTIDENNRAKLNGQKNKSNGQEQSESLDYHYKLYGVIVHSGSSRWSGHYYSYCRGFENENSWYKCNDDDVRKMPNGIEGAMGKQAYILMYQLVTNSNQPKPKKEKKVMEVQMQQSQESTSATTNKLSPAINNFNQKHDIENVNGSIMKKKNKEKKDKSENADEKVKIIKNPSEPLPKKQQINHALPFAALGAEDGAPVSKRTRKASTEPFTIIDEQPKKENKLLSRQTIDQEQAKSKSKPQVKIKSNENQKVHEENKQLSNGHEAKGILKSKELMGKNKQRTLQEVGFKIMADSNLNKKQKLKDSSSDRKKHNSLLSVMTSLDKNNDLIDIMDDNLTPSPSALMKTPSLSKNDSRISLVSKTSMTSSCLARQGFTSMKKRLHPVIRNPEGRKRRFDTLQSLCNSSKLNISSTASPKMQRQSSGLGLKSPTPNFEYNGESSIQKLFSQSIIHKSKKNRNGLKRRKTNNIGD